VADWTHRSWLRSPLDTSQRLVLFAAGEELETPAERAFREQLATVVGAPYVVATSRERLFPALDALNSHADQPTGGLFAGVFRTLAQEAHERGIDVMLTGDGADDIFAANPMIAADHLRARRWAAAVESVLTLGGLGGRGALRGTAAVSIAPVVSRLTPSTTALMLAHAARSRTLALEELWTTDFLRMRDQRAAAAIRTWRDVLEEGRSFAYEQVLWNVRSGVEASYDFFTGISARVRRATPFRSMSVIETYGRCDLRRQLSSAGGTRDKALLRAAAANVLPDRIRFAPKVGRWDLVQRLLRPEQVEAEQRLEAVADRLSGVVVNDALPALLEVPETSGRTLVSLLLLESWTRTLEERVGRSVTL
jgi:asparagine synthetase B (glutamine-hydrolysing)